MVSMRMEALDHWSWDTGAPAERGQMVRQHVVAAKGDHSALADLFLLTEDGVRKILAGDCWRPEYDRK